MAVQPRADPDASSSGSSSGSRSGRIRSGTHRKRVAKQREAKAQASAGDLSCPVCAGVGTQKAFKSVPGFVGHLNNAHIALQVPVPEDFWRAQAAVRCCRVCRMAFGNTGNRKHAVCPPCRKLGLRDPLPPAPVSAEAAAEPEAGDARAAEQPAPEGELPSWEEIMAQPLLTASRVPGPVRAKWTKIFAKLCSDAVFHKDNPRYWTLWTMFQKAGLCQPPPRWCKEQELPLAAAGRVGARPLGALAEAQGASATAQPAAGGQQPRGSSAPRSAGSA